jgi:hypothetical protein
MTRLSPNTPKDEVLKLLDSVSNAIVGALKTALKETKRQFHSLGTPLDPEKPYDKSYFSHTMRYIAKRALNESGLQARIEEEAEAGYEVGQAANTGIILQIPSVVARLLKCPLDEDLPRPGSESRAEFYEQRQYRLPFPPLEGEIAVEEGEDNKVLHLVYAWDVDPTLERAVLKLVCPNERSGKYQWQHIFTAAEMGGVGDTNVPVPTSPLLPLQTLIAAAAAAANTDLDLSPKTEETKERVNPGAAKRA